MGLALLLAGPFLLARRGAHYLPTLAGRLGGGPAGGSDAGLDSGSDGAWNVASGGGSVSGSDGGSDGGRSGAPGAWRGRLWLHAVSVGEVGVAATLARALPPDLPLLVTTVTPTGQALARKAFAGRAPVAYLPFDLRPALGRLWRRFSPAALVLVEGDYWPLLLRETRRRGLTVAVVNGRVGDRSYGRMRRLRPLARRLLFSGIGSFGVQSAADGRRLQALGVEGGRITVTGNLKFETRQPDAHRGLGAALGRLAGGRPLLIAGSTMPGEEEQVLAAFAAVGGGRRALLVLAPRHPERWDEVHRQLRASGLEVQRRSRLNLAAASGVNGAGEAEAANRGEREAAAHQDGGAAANEGREAATHGAPDVVLLDSMGELSGLYRLAAAAFVGGTLAPTGGHNPLEAARYGIPIAVGPSMHNFREMAKLFDRAGAWRRVADAAALGSAWEQWLSDPAAARRQGERAAALLDENRGALARTLDMLAPVLATLAPPAVAPGGPLG